MFFNLPGGPFLITCGNKYNRYLRVVPVGNKNTLMASEKKEEASVFYIEKNICPGEFSIAHYDDQPNTLDKSSSMYVTTKSKSKLTGKDSGPLQVGGGRGANFSLRHVVKSKESLSINDWEKDACYIKLAARLTQHNSYIGLNEKSGFTVCVPKRSTEKMNSTWLRFKLERIRNEDSNRMTVYRAPGANRGSKPELVRYSEEEEDEELVDFQFEFEQIPSQDSD